MRMPRKIQTGLEEPVRSLTRLNGEKSKMKKRMRKVSNGI